MNASSNNDSLEQPQRRQVKSPVLPLDVYMDQITRKYLAQAKDRAEFAQNNSTVLLSTPRIGSPRRPADLDGPAAPNGAAATDASYSVPPSLMPSPRRFTPRDLPMALQLPKYSAAAMHDMQDEYVVIDAPRRSQRGGITERGILISPPATSRHTNSSLELQPETFCVSCQGKLLYVEDSTDYAQFHANIRSAMQLTRHETFQLLCDGKQVLFDELRNPSNRGKAFSLTPAPWHVNPGDFLLNKQHMSDRPGMLLFFFGVLKNMPVSAHGSLLIKPHVASQFDDKTIDAHYDSLRRLADLWQTLPAHPCVQPLLRIFYADVQLPGRKDLVAGLPLYFINPCLSGSLEDEAIRFAISDASRRTLLEALPRTFSQIVSALNHLHENDIVHGDVRCANFLVKGDFPRRDTSTVIVSNFGFGVSLRCSHKLWSQHVTAKETMAPEVALRMSDPTRASDAWGIGIAMLECLDHLRANTFGSDSNKDSSCKLVQMVSKIVTQRHLSSAWRQDELDILFDGEMMRVADDVDATEIFGRSNVIGQLLRLCLRVEASERILLPNASAMFS